MSRYVRATVQSAIVCVVCYGMYYGLITGTEVSRVQLEKANQPIACLLLPLVNSKMALTPSLPLNYVIGSEGEEGPDVD